MSNTEKIKELEKQIADAQTELQQLGITRSNETAKLESSFNSSFLSLKPKLVNFKSGDNFGTFCDRFETYIDMTGFEGTPNLHILFLQHVDNSTYSILKPAVENMTLEQCSNSRSICTIFKEAIYGASHMLLKSNLLDLTQKTGETLDQFVVRIREIAQTAYVDSTQQNEACLLTLLRGLTDLETRRDMNKQTFATFSDAVRYAKQCEMVNNLTSTTPVSTILKTTASNDTEPSRYGQTSSQNDFSRGRDRYRSNSRGRDNYRSNSRGRDNYRSDSRGRNNYRSDSRGRDNYRSNSRYSRSQSRDRYDRNRHRSPTPYNNRRNMKCYYCDQTGHLQYDCRKKRSDRQGNY